jgi:hypothetical protein
MPSLALRGRRVECTAGRGRLTGGDRLRCPPGAGNLALPHQTQSEYPVENPLQEEMQQMEQIYTTLIEFFVNYSMQVLVPS